MHGSRGNSRKRKVRRIPESTNYGNRTMFKRRGRSRGPVSLSNDATFKRFEVRPWDFDSQGLTQTSVIKRFASAVDEIALRIVAESTERQSQLFRIPLVFLETCETWRTTV
jgi:hypothetical protein